MRASLNQNQRANKQRNVFNKLAFYYWAMASKWPNILCDVKQNNFNSLLLYFMQSLEQMLFIRTSVVKRERKSEWERVSLIFNILVFRSQLFSMVQNMYSHKIELKTLNDDRNECKITQNSSIFMKSTFSFHILWIWNWYVRQNYLFS